MIVFAQRRPPRGLPESSEFTETLLRRGCDVFNDLEIAALDRALVEREAHNFTCLNRRNNLS
jgi:hypothetical protein